MRGTYRKNETNSLYYYNSGELLSGKCQRWSKVVMVGKYVAKQIPDQRLYDEYFSTFGKMLVYECEEHGKG